MSYEFMKVIPPILLLSLCSCFIGTCEPDWEGTYSASVFRGFRGCIDPPSDMPGVEEAKIEDAGNGKYDVYLFDPNSPDCMLEFHPSDDNVVTIWDAYNCEGGVVPLGFSIGYGSMSLLHGKMRMFLEWWNRDNTDCWLIDDWTLD